MVAALFRFRGVIYVLLYALGFLAPWQHFLGGGDGTLWLAISTLLARTGWLTVAEATRCITLLGLGSLVLGTALRVLGTAYLGDIGTWLLAMPTSLLMPSDGAAVFVPAFSVFIGFLITTRVRSPVPAIRVRPHWLRAILDETYPVAFTLCFAIFAWSYNARIMIRCLLVCFGLSLVARALTQGQTRA